MNAPPPEETSDPEAILLSFALAAVVCGGVWIGAHLNGALRWALFLLVVAGSSVYCVVAFGVLRRWLDESSATTAARPTTADGLHEPERRVQATLGGARVAFFESRRAQELASLVTRHGGRPVMVPALVEEAEPQAVRWREAVQPLLQGSADIVVAMTGVAVDLVVAAAKGAEERERLRAALRKATIVCRGPKPAAALRAFGAPPAVLVPEPHTAPHLIATLESIGIDGKRVLILDGGDSGSPIHAELSARGARVFQVFLYRWTLPEDRRALLRGFIRELLSGGVDAIAFTAQVQVRFLMATASDAGLGVAVRDCLGEDVLVASVGPVCTAALRAEGIRAHVEPAHPKMGHMVVALARYLTANPRLRTTS